LIIENLYVDIVLSIVRSTSENAFLSCTVSGIDTEGNENHGLYWNIYKQIENKFNTFKKHVSEKRIYMVAFRTRTASFISTIKNLWKI
jgi:hypothetical protein